VRAQLLTTGAFDIGQLCALRNDPGTQTTEAALQQAGKSVLAINVDGQVVYPAFQFTDQGAPRDEIAAVIEVLQVAGLGPWQTWSWLVEPTGMLSGEVPVELVFTEPSRVTEAVARLAARVQG
jgi:hypothetical protein